MRKLLLLIAFGFVFVIISSFIKTDTSTSEKLIAQSQSMVFNTDGLYYAEFYDFIYRGHFEHIKMKRDDVQFIMIFEKYLRAFGKQCTSYLPANKVPIMELECAKEEQGLNAYGDVIRRTCIKWRWVKTGLYARPDLYNAKMKIEGIQRDKGLETVINMVTDPNSMGNSVDLMHKAKGLQNDMAQIFIMNKCNSPGVRRFEENLKLFALKKPSIRMKAISKYASMKKTGGPSGSQNFKKLINDLVANQAKTWTLNRYTNGSVSGVSILSKDSQGRPTSLKANYKYTGFGNSGNGWAKITFKNGLPNCIYFFDFPNNCKTPNSGIVASYAQGNYGE